MKYIRLLLVTAGVCCYTLAGAQRLPEELDTLPTTAHYLQQPIDRAHVYHPRLCGLLIPGAMLTYGFVALENHTLRDFNYSTKKELQEDHPHFSTTVDNYLQWSPAIAVYALNALGAKGEHNLVDRTLIYGTSTLIMASTVRIIKKAAHSQRPDGSNYESFPSGHTATAFAAAEFMRMEYQHNQPLLSMTGYIAAAATGALRMYNNRHWFSDIMGGAGLGILSTQAAYALYPVMKRYLFPSREHSSAFLMPYYDPELKVAGCKLLMVSK